MKDIAHRLNAYIESHASDLGDGSCETVLDQLYQAYAESHESDPADISDGFKELEEYLCELPLEDNNAVLISVVACVAHMNAKLFVTDCNMAHIL